MNMTAELLAYSLRVQVRERNIQAGITGLVHGFYDQYTDATSLEPALLSQLKAVLAFADYDWDDALEDIHDTEKKINEAGGVRSDTNGTRHPVRTPQAWAEDNDDRCTTCHRDAHRPGTGWQGHDYAGPAGEAEPG